MFNNNIVEILLNYIFLSKCLYCKRYGKIICDNCLNKINREYLFKKVNNDWFDYVFCGCFYEGKIRTQIHSFKFHEQAYLYKYFIQICLRDKKIYEFLKKFDYITYVPMYYKKEQKRGYNQSKLLAEELGKNLELQVIELLEKKKENKVQSSLSEKDRIKNVKNIFCFKDNSIKNNSIKGKNIILVDDILTTGATVRASSKILKENEAEEICVFTVAKT